MCDNIDVDETTGNEQSENLSKHNIPATTLSKDSSSNLKAVGKGFTAAAKGQDVGSAYGELLKNDAGKIKKLSDEFHAFDAAVRNTLKGK